MEKFITEKVLLALLGKGMLYEIEDMEMEYDIKVPMDIFGIEDSDEPQEMDVKMKMKVGKMTFEIIES